MSPVGSAELIITLPAHLMLRFHGLFPGTTSNLFGLVNRLLPDAETDLAGAVPGTEIAARHPSMLRDAITLLGRSAARRFHQFPGQGEGRDAGVATQSISKETSG